MQDSGKAAAVVGQQEPSSIAGITASIGWHVVAGTPYQPFMQSDLPHASNMPAEPDFSEKEVIVKVGLNPRELVLLRRAIARAADDGLLDRTLALNRICALDAFRWEAEEDLKADQVRAVMIWLANRKWAIGEVDMQELTGWDWKDKQ